MLKLRRWKQQPHSIGEMSECSPPQWDVKAQVNAIKPLALPLDDTGSGCDSICDGDLVLEKVWHL